MMGPKQALYFAMFWICLLFISFCFVAPARSQNNLFCDRTGCVLSFSGRLSFDSWEALVDTYSDCRNVCDDICEDVCDKTIGANMNAAESQAYIKSLKQEITGLKAENSELRDKLSKYETPKTIGSRTIPRREASDDASTKDTDS